MATRVRFTRLSQPSRNALPNGWPPRWSGLPRVVHFALVLHRHRRRQPSLVESGGTLGGNGSSVGGATVQSGGTLDPGLQLAPARLTLDGDLADNASRSTTAGFFASTTRQGRGQYTDAMGNTFSINWRTVTQLPTM